MVFYVKVSKQFIAAKFIVDSVNPTKLPRVIYFHLMSV